MFRSGNPTLSEKAFREVGFSADRSATMTVEGAATKTGILVLVTGAAAAFTWGMVANGNAQAMPLMFGGMAVGLVVGLILFFKQAWAPVLAPVYAVAEGFLLGGLSSWVDRIYPGIAFQAICLTFGTLFTLMTAYRMGFIKATPGFTRGLIAATGAVMLVYLVSMVARWFGYQIPYIHSAGPIGIGFSAVVVVIAALNLVLDFHAIEEGARYQAPKYMEWYCAYGMLVTLVWLYIEILHLLMKIQQFAGGNDD